MTDSVNEAQPEIQEEKTIPLRKPVTLGKGDAAITYNHLDLREPTAGELSKAMRVGGGNNVEQAISLISQIAKVPMGVAQGLCQRDLQECSDFLGSFTADGPITGETSLQS